MGSANIYTWERTPSNGSLRYISSQSDAYAVSFDGDIAAYVEAKVPRDEPIGTDSGRMCDVALVRAYANIRNTSVMSGEIAGDLHRTISMFKRPFGNARDILGRMLKSAKRSYGKTTRSVARANASAWLEYRYGLMPTVMDAKSIARQVANSRDSLSRRRLVSRATEKQSRSSTKSFTDVSLMSPWGWSGTGSVNTTQTLSAHAGVMYEVKNRTRSEQISTDFRLGVDSLAQTAWELTPFSFVADWFWNVGPWLEAMILPPDVQVIGNWVTTVNVLEWSTSATIKWSTVPPATGASGTSTNKFSQMIRSVNQPLPTTPLPSMNWQSVLHAADGASLALNPVLGLIDKLRH